MKTNPSSHSPRCCGEKKKSITLGFSRARLLPALILLVVSLFMTGCSCNRTTVVLLPDADNHVGRVALSNDHGTCVIDQAGYGVTLSRETSPGEPAPMPPAEIKKRFAQVLDAEPERPAKFILQFKSGSAVLLPASLARIPEIVAEVNKRDAMDISVAGHSDRVGNEDANIALSLKRAERVQQLLVEQGVEERFIHASSHGEGNPLVPTADDVPEPANRRVEVIVR